MLMTSPWHVTLLRKLKEAAITMDATVLCWGLTFNTKKTKELCVDKMQLKLQIHNVIIPILATS